VAATIVAGAGPPSATAAAPAAAAAVTTLDRACLPILRGADLKATARSAGFVLRNGAWVRELAGGRQVQLDPPDASNPHQCSARLLSGPEEGPALRAALSLWASEQSPPLAPAKVDEHERGPLFDRATSTWFSAAGGSESLLLSQEKTLGGKPVHGALNVSELSLSLGPT
jgi:hypothetical protein